MPFMGKDWRSPGEAWVKTESLGWQRMKIIESQLQPNEIWCSAKGRAHLSSYSASSRPCSSSNCSWPPDSELGQHMARHCCANSSTSSATGTRSVSDGSSSTGSSRHSSASPSPSDSPEKQPATYGRPIELSSTKISCLSSPWLDESRRPNSAPAGDCCLETETEESSTNRIHRIYRTNCCCNNNCFFQPLNHQHKDLDSHSNQNKESPQFWSCRDGQPNHPRQPFIRTAPHCKISVRTREVAMYNTISEAFYRLDFCNAIHDIRRFNYICKLLHLLITQNLTSLSGCATRVLFILLEQIACEVSANKRNIHVLRNLLNELKQTIHKYYCWGRPIGSSVLWQQHFDTIERIGRIVDAIELAPDQPTDLESAKLIQTTKSTQMGSSNPRVTFNDLPVEMVREILLRLNDYRDLLSSAEASPVMGSMIEGQYLWQRLCRYHFNEQQVQLALTNLAERKSTLGSNWRHRAGGQSRRRDQLVGRRSSGVKYVRTASADGRTSFRKPVVIASSSGSRPESSEQAPTGRSVGYVTRAIRIFDREPMTKSAGPSRLPEVAITNRDSSRRGSITTAATTSTVTNENNRPSRQTESSTVSHRRIGADGIDWEFVFHQLRKKFDLKEEYADCLLLCRHCRCLFWKSIGHPCVMGDDTPPAGQLSSGPSRATAAATSSGQTRSPISVAELSRTFDQSHSDGMQNRPPPEVPAASRRPNASRQNSNANNPTGYNAPIGPAQANNLIERALRERNANRRPLEPLPANNVNSRMEVRELVPKHVAISPQAFLKFFSL